MSPLTLQNNFRVVHGVVDIDLDLTESEPYRLLGRVTIPVQGTWKEYAFAPELESKLTDAETIELVIRELKERDCFHPWLMDTQILPDDVKQIVKQINTLIQQESPNWRIA